MKAIMVNKTTLVLLLFVIFAPSVLEAKKKDKDRYSVRMYEFLVTVVSVDDESSSVGYDRSSSATPHHDVAVHVRIKNLSKQFPCTGLSAFLQVEPYNQYHQSWTAGSQPLLGDLLPGQVVEFDYPSRARDGTRPAMLILKAESSSASLFTNDQRCTQHVDWGSVWHARTEARLPLDGLPTRGVSNLQP
jgi:hypothetical protein